MVKDINYWVRAFSLCKEDYESYIQALIKQNELEWRVYFRTQLASAKEKGLLNYDVPKPTKRASLITCQQDLITHQLI